VPTYFINKGNVDKNINTKQTNKRMNKQTQTFY